MRSASALRSRSASAPRATASSAATSMPYADRFAVAEAAILRHRLERVAGGVAEVQDPPQSGFAFVGRRRPPP